MLDFKIKNNKKETKKNKKQNKQPDDDTMYLCLKKTFCCDLFLFLFFDIKNLTNYYIKNGKILF